MEGKDASCLSLDIRNLRTGILDSPLQAGNNSRDFPSCFGESQFAIVRSFYSFPVLEIVGKSCYILNFVLYKGSIRMQEGQSCTEKKVLNIFKAEFDRNNLKERFQREREQKINRHFWHNKKNKYIYIVKL